MGRIHFLPNQFPAAVSEIVGYKSGVALSFEEMGELIARQDKTLLTKWPSSAEEPVIVRSEVFEAILSSLLFSVGAIDVAGITPPGLGVWHKYKNDNELSQIERTIFNEFIYAFERDQETLKSQSAKEQPFDATPFVEDMANKHGAAGFRIAMELVGEFQNAVMRSPNSMFRQVEWRDLLELKSLFESESLDASHGKFVDQRFIEYLGQQFGDVDRMNWRKFEGLTGEYFHRLGFDVDMGPGRNDGGIDIRIWHPDSDRNSPPLILIQCKREKAKVGKTVVKALWADVVAENASSGLVVTSTSLSPGARNVCYARSYPVVEANRSTLKKWIFAMRRPNSGVFFGE